MVSFSSPDMVGQSLFGGEKDWIRAGRLGFLKRLFFLISALRFLPVVGQHDRERRALTLCAFYQELASVFFYDNLIGHTEP